MTTSSKLLTRLAALPEVLSFSRFPIDKQTVFYASDTTFAFTNLKPVVPGHVLVSPIRVVDRLTSLSDCEVRDLFATARIVGHIILKAHPQADSLTFTVQDGPSAGQTVAHVHVHIMPRWKDDRFNLCKQGNDSVYEAIDTAEEGMHCEHGRVDEQTSVAGRSPCDMIAEAKDLFNIAIEVSNSSQL